LPTATYFQVGIGNQAVALDSEKIREQWRIPEGTHPLVTHVSCSENALPSLVEIGHDEAFARHFDPTEGMTQLDLRNSLVNNAYGPDAGDNFTYNFHQFGLIAFGVTQYSLDAEIFDQIYFGSTSEITISFVYRLLEGGMNFIDDMIPPGSRGKYLGEPQASPGDAWHLIGGPQRTPLG